MYILKNYPQMSETYIKTEIEAVAERCEIAVLATKKANLPAKNHVPFELVEDISAIREAIEEFNPDVLHSHWLHSVKILGKLARQMNIPFTVRAHSFDSIWQEDKSTFDFLPLIRSFRLPSRIRRAVSLINDDLCLGILAFPFARARLERAGIRSEKIVDCYPVVNYRRFHNVSPNGEAIMNVGACIPKKKMEDFIELGTLAPKLQFNLYALGYNVEQLRQFSINKASPVNFISPIELEDMPSEYKKHRWLVYTAAVNGRVGWPMAIAEAQAAGVGVCMANIRPDLREYVGRPAFCTTQSAKCWRSYPNPLPRNCERWASSTLRNQTFFRTAHRCSNFGRRRVQLR